MEISVEQWEEFQKAMNAVMAIKALDLADEDDPKPEKIMSTLLGLRNKS